MIRPAHPRSLPCRLERSSQMSYRLQNLISTHRQQARQPPVAARQQRLREGPAGSDVGGRGVGGRSGVGWGAPCCAEEWVGEVVVRMLQGRPWGLALKGGQGSSAAGLPAYDMSPAQLPGNLHKGHSLEAAPKTLSTPWGVPCHSALAAPAILPYCPPWVEGYSGPPRQNRICQ